MRRRPEHRSRHTGRYFRGTGQKAGTINRPVAMSGGPPALRGDGNGDHRGREPVHERVGAMRPSASPTSSLWCASTMTGCVDDPVGGWRCQKAFASTPDSRAGHTSRCCCTGKVAPGTAVRCRSGPFRTPQEDCSPPSHRPRVIRPLPVACPPCRPYPFVSLSISPFQEVPSA